MKKLLTIVLIAILSLALVVCIGCKKSDAEKGKEVADQVIDDAEEIVEDAPETGEEAAAQ